MKIQKTILWRGLKLAAGAVVVGLMISSIAFAQRGGGGKSGAGGRGGGQGGNSRMGGSSSFSRSGMQRSGGSSNVRQGGAGGTVNRGSAPSANFSNRSFSSAGNKAISGGIVSRRTTPSSNFGNRNLSSVGNKALSGGTVTARQSGGFQGTNPGSSSFVQKNFGSATSKSRSYSERRSGTTSNPTNTSRGNSGFVSRNFDQPGGTNGIGKIAQGNANLGGQQYGGLNKKYASNNYAYNHGGSTNDFNKDWNGDNNHGNWNGDSNHGNWNGNHGNWNGYHDNGSHYYHKPFYGYGNYGYYPYRNNYWYLPLISLAWGFPFGGYAPSYGYGDIGYGGGGYYDNGYSPSTVYYSAPITDTNAQVVDPASVQIVDPSPVASNDNSTDVANFVGQGEANFKAGKYEAASRSFRHALVDDPNNGAYMMILGQALFASGQYNEAAGATQQAAQMLSPDKWGTIVTNYKELYSNIGDYTSQLRALEKARDEKPNDPALHFLLGWHYGYLGYPTQAISELNKTLELVPSDQVAKKVRDAMDDKLPKTELPAPAPGEKPVPPDVK